MRHHYFGYKLSRNKNQRRRLFQSLVREVVARGQIKTTLTKAKAVQGLIDKLITKAKLNLNQGRISVDKILANRILTDKLIFEAQNRFKGRTSGYTRIIRLGSRLGDSAQEVYLTYVDSPLSQETVKKVIKQKTVKSKS